MLDWFAGQFLGSNLLGVPHAVLLVGGAALLSAPAFLRFFAPFDQNG